MMAITMSNVPEKRSLSRRCWFGWRFQHQLFDHVVQKRSMFCPDLTRSHYAKKTLNWLTEQNITYVPKKDNPPNVLQACPIEDFWSVLKRNVYEKGREAQNEQQLTGRIKRKLTEIDPLLCQRMILKVPYLL